MQPMIRVAAVHHGNTGTHAEYSALPHSRQVHVPFSTHEIAVMTLTSWGRCPGSVTSHHETFWYKVVADTPNFTRGFQPEMYV